MRTALEVQMSRRQTRAQILTNPITVILNRSPRNPTDAGGYVLGTPVPQTPQVVTLIPFKRRFSEFIVGTELGNVPDAIFLLVGAHDCNILREDTFSYQGDTYKVEQIDPDREVRTAAAITSFSETTNG